MKRLDLQKKLIESIEEYENSGFFGNITLKCNYREGMCYSINIIRDEKCIK